MALELKGFVSLDGSGWESGLNRVAGSLKSFIATAFGIFGVQAAFRSTIESIEELVDTSKRLGVGFEQLQILKRGLSEAGTELGTLTKAFEKLYVAKDKALSGSEEGQKLLKSLSRLGISPEALRNQTAAELFMGPLSAKAKVTSPADLALPLREIFRRSYGELIGAMLKDWAEVEDRMRSLGAIMDTETATKLHELGESLSIVKQILMVQFAGGMLTIVDKLMSGIEKFLQWMDDRIKPPEKAATATEGAGGLWGFSGKAGAAIMGGINGVLGLADDLYGNREKADARLIDAMKWFEMAGVNGGWLLDAADKLAKRMAEGKPGLADTFSNWRKGLEESAAELAWNLKHPIPSAGPPDDSKAPKVKLHKDNGDALIRVGNFLSSSRGALETLAQQQLNYTRQIADNTAAALRQGVTGEMEW